MSGRHVAPWAVYTDDEAVDTVFPPTNHTFAVTQSHWFRFTCPVVAALCRFDRG
jgi:hypothetical protein